MPYDPKITDQRGALRAQGIVAAGNNYGGALANMGQQFQQFQQNRLLANQAVGQIEGALKANPELFDILTKSEENPNGPQPPSQAAQAFLKLQKNGALPMQDAALLSQYVQTYAGTKAEAQKAQLQQAQINEAKARTAQANVGADSDRFSLQQRQGDQASQDSLNARLQEMVKRGQQLQSGVGSGVLRQEAQKALQDFMGSSAGQLAQQGVQLTPAMMQKLAETEMQTGYRYQPKALPPGAQMVTLGTDSYGRVIQGIKQPNGTIDRIPDPSGTSFEVGPNGQITFRQGAAGNLTTQASTDSQRAQYNAERIIKEGAGVMARLRPEDVGVRGNITENVVNRGLAQIDPTLADQTVANNRTALRAWREGTLKSVSNDTRFSTADRVAIEKLLPDDGYFESLPSAQAKMLAVMHIMQGRAGMEAARRGATKSVVELAPDELVKMAKSGTLEKDVAAALISTLHPDWLAEQKKADKK